MFKHASKILLLSGYNTAFWVLLLDSLEEPEMGKGCCTKVLSSHLKAKILWREVSMLKEWHQLNMVLWIQYLCVPVGRNHDVTSSGGNICLCAVVINQPSYSLPNNSSSGISGTRNKEFSLFFFLPGKKYFNYSANGAFYMDYTDLSYSMAGSEDIRLFFLLFKIDVKGKTAGKQILEIWWKEQECKHVFPHTGCWLDEECLLRLNK